jgi:putative AlgH/UPF0301 family transcriptional regulator
MPRHLFAFILINSLNAIEAFAPRFKDRSTSTQGFDKLKISRCFRRATIALPRVGSLSLSNSDPDSSEEEKEEEEDFEPLLPDQDWRNFRAKLVMSESSPEARPRHSTVSSDDGDLDGIGALFQESSGSTSSENDSSAKFQGLTPLDPSQWAYDTGKIIEQGAVILGGVEQEFGFGLRQQYFHKSAILVLDHGEKVFTKGIILNRPTDLTLEDDINPGVKWRVWFGGDVQGLNSDNPEVVCLHSLRNEQAIKASRTVMKDIQWTTFENANRLVRAGVAKPTDFWVFMGYAGWGAGQLMGELDRKSWYMVATDSQTLLKELARLSAGADPRDAGLDTWNLLMNMIGRWETAEEYSGDFDDLMLKEWALRHLLSTGAGGGAGQKQISLGATSATAESGTNWFSRFTLPRVEEVVEGSLVRASSADRSPFLLDDQEFHKSVILIIKDDESVSVGLILNRPAAKGLDIKIQNKNTGGSKSVTLPLRFGGKYAVQGSEPLMWLHCNPVLRAAEVGSPVGPKKDGIWKCSAEDVIKAIGRDIATPEDFIVVTGVCAWSKTDESAEGIQGEVKAGRFEVIPAARAEAVWNNLLKLEVLTTVNLVKNLAMAGDAWSIGSNGSPKQIPNKNHSPPPLTGIGECYDEDDDTLVFKSDVKVSKLSDDALRSWVATFLLGAPTLGG